MTPEPNFEDMSFKPLTINPELDPDTNFLKVFFPLIKSILL